MNMRTLGRTGLKVSEIGLGGEWLERHTAEEVKQIILCCEENGINILDCWMSNPEVRTKIGDAIEGRRDKWIIQGHIGSTWQNGQYARSRELDRAKEAFADLLTRLKTDYIDLGMIHFIDEEKEWNHANECGFIDLVKAYKAQGRIRFIGMSTHNPKMAKKAALSGFIDVILFSVNPAFDLLPPNEDLNVMFGEDAYHDEALRGISPEREELYRLCARENVAITVMKGYGGGRLFNKDASPFGVALTPVQCLHYALTRPAVASVMVGYDTPEQVRQAAAYETATAEEKDYASVLAGAPRHAFFGQCTYCGHCSPCPKHIDIAMVNKYLDLALMQNEVPATIRAHYDALAHNASDCIACGACHARCPFGVNIVDKMKRAKTLFVK